MLAAQESIFVGRAAELSTLRWAVERARAAERQMVVITGEPGVGKTRLARRVAEGEGRNGSLVHGARCWQWGGAPAMWPWVQVFREIAIAERARGGSPLADDVDRLLDRLAAKGEAPVHDHSRFALFDDVMEILVRAGQVQPRLIHIDDIHAADPTSVDLLRFFARDARPACVVIMATARDVDADSSSEVAALLEDLYLEATLIKLRGLQGDELRDLIEQISDESPAASVVAAVHRRTNGNPLFIDGLVRAATSAGGLEAIATGQYVIPPGIRGAIDRRLRSFEHADRAALAAVAVIGRDCAPELVANVIQLDQATVCRSFRRAEEEALLEQTPPGSGRFGFSHALLADALYRELDPAARQALHGAVGCALEQGAGMEIELHAAELARHYLSAGSSERLQRGIDLAIIAGDRAYRICAYDEAAAFFERALEAMDVLGSADVERKGALLLKLSDSLLALGRPELARAPLRRLVQLDPSDALFAEAALCMARTGEFAVPHREAIQLLTEAEQRLSDRKDGLRVRVLSRLATAVWTDQRATDQRRTYTQTATTLAEELGDLHALAVALAARMSALADPAHLEERLQGVERLSAVATSCGDPSLMFEANRWRLNAYWEAGDRVNADAALDEYERLAEQLRWPQARMNAALRRAVLGEMTGDLSMLEAQLARLEAYGRQARDPQTDMYLAVGRLSLARERGRVEEVRGHLTTAMAACHLWRQLAAPAGAAVECLRAAGHEDEARAMYERYAVDGFRSVPIGFGTVSAYAMFGEACAAFGDVERAPLLRDLLVPFSEHNTAAGLLTCKGAAARYVALLELLLGNVTGAVDYFERALRINRRVGARGFLAYTLRDYAVALTARGRADDMARAGTLLAEARTLAEHLGFTKLLAELSGTARSASLAAPSLENRLELQGDSWTLAFGGHSVRLRDSRGVRYIHRLIDQSGREVHALELSAGEGADLESLGGDAGPVLDRQARDEYRSRVEQLREQIAEAERCNDLLLGERARVELEAIANQLAEGLGLGGRSRRAGSASERARVAVSRAIKRSIDKIARAHPAAAEHLERFITTGTYCRYDPAPELRISWILSR